MSKSLSLPFMTALERRAVVSLSLILSLRMIGLFMVLPVFAIYAQDLKGATPALIGIAIGIYGLSQALFQIPFGALSDRLGRKPIIFFGLIIFSIGSLIAALSDSITGMILGRALQGVGAVGSTLLALMADLTTEVHRTKAMAIAGISIGLSFSIAMLLGPLLMQKMGVNHLFFIAMLLGVIGIMILFLFVPTPTNEYWHRETEPELSSFLTLLFKPELAQLNAGIFLLHLIFTASFVAIPLSLLHTDQLALASQWMVYVPALIVALVLCLFCINQAERRQKVKPYFIAGVITLGLAEFLMWCMPQHLYLFGISLCLFFAGFSLLEAFLPSLISRIAPATRKGSALGIYSCMQFLGIFVGGLMGGWLYGQFNVAGVYLFCAILVLLWLAFAVFMHPPRYLVTQMWCLSPSFRPHWNSIATQLSNMPGMVEVSFIAAENKVYLKMERHTAIHPDFIYLKERITEIC